MKQARSIQMEALRHAITLVVAQRLALMAVGIVAVLAVPNGTSPHLLGSQLWVHWDAWWYLGIAQHGYSLGADYYAYFPLFPLAVRFTEFLIGPHPVLAGFLLNGLAQITGYYFLYLLVRRHSLDGRLAERTLLYLTLFPTAFFFGAVYSESLFFCLAVLAVYLIQEDLLVSAGIAAGLAALTRDVGIFLAAALAAAGSSLHPFRPALSGRKLLALALPPLFFSLFLGYMYLHTGNPLFFLRAEAIHWHRTIVFPWSSVYLAAQRTLQTASLGQDYLNDALDLSATLLFLFLLVYGWRSRQPVLNIFAVFALLIPLSSVVNVPTSPSILLSMSRFVLVIFPCFITLARLGRSSWLDSAVRIVFPTLQAALFYAWIHGVWIA